MPYKAVFLFLMFAVVACDDDPEAPGAPVIEVPAADRAALLTHVGRLAHDSMRGRGSATLDERRAAQYIEQQFAAFGLDGTSLMPFILFSGSSATSQNVLGVLPGSGTLRDEWVVLGGHYDHVGKRLLPTGDSAIFNGADDNASGTAVVLELARLLSDHVSDGGFGDGPRRSVLFIAFGAEELGLIGSERFCAQPAIPLASIVAMLNFDMVGRLRDDRLIIYGVATAEELNEIITRANAVAPLSVTATGDGFGASDHSSFYAKNLPVLHFFTNVHDDYHRATDDAERVNATGVGRVVSLAERIARDIGDRASPLTFVRAVAAAPTTSSRAGTTAYLGSIPDMGASEVTGVRLTGVRAGSPADNAGLKAGDIIVELGGKPVKDLYAYTDALYSHKPGDTVDIVVLRGTERVTVKVTLGRRGG